MGDRKGWSWDFVEQRRRYLNDRAWFGLALVAIGLGGVGPESSWWVGFPIAAVGTALAAWGLADRK